MSAPSATSSSNQRPPNQRTRSRRNSTASNASGNHSDSFATDDDDDVEQQIAELTLAEKAQQKKRAAKKGSNQEATTDDVDDVDEPDDDDEDDYPAPTSVPSTTGNDDDLVMKTLSGKTLRMHRAVWGRWSMTDYAAIKVRSKQYASNGVKIQPPCPPMMDIKNLEMYMCNTQIHHVCSYENNWLRQLKAARAKRTASSSSPTAYVSKPNYEGHTDLSSGEGLRPFDPDFFFVVTFHVQTDPTFHLSLYFQRRDLVSSGGAAGPEEEYHEPQAAARAKKAFDTLFQRFIDGDDEFRNSRLKLIPYVVDGQSSE